MKRLVALGLLSIAACDTLPSNEYALEGEVEIVRDSLGVVHIRASSDEDAFYASGYMQATDRLFQMDLTRRRALGRSAEVLGPGAVGDDRFIRTIDIARLGREAAEHSRREHPDDYHLFVAWTAGVNARIDEVRSGSAPLPYGFGPDELDYAPEHWEPSDAFTVGKLILFGNANQIEFDLLATIIRDYMAEGWAQLELMRPLTPAFVLAPEERPVQRASEPIVAEPRDPLRLPDDARERLRRVLDIVPRLTSRYSSNNWAVDGRHTDNGRPYVAGDPHQPLRSPSLFWMQHLDSASAGGRFDVIGFSFVGTPPVQLGHNRDIAWTATTSYCDFSDLWDVAIEDGAVRLGDERLPIETRMEEIAVRDAEPVVFEAETVPGVGVLLPDDFAPIPVVRSGRRILFGWTGFAPTNEGHAFLELNVAPDLDAFERAVEGMEIGAFNFVAADASGIRYRSAPLVPDRGDPSTLPVPYALLDGDDPRTVWTGAFLPLDVLPRSDGGARGWIESANNDPYGFTEDGSFAGDPFYFGAFFDPGARSQRIESELERLTARGAVAREDMQALQLDAHSVLADLALPVIAEAWAEAEGDESLAALRNDPALAAIVLQLEGWDRQNRRDSSAAVAFDVVLHYLADLVIADELPLVFQPILDESPIYMMKWVVRALRGEIEMVQEVLDRPRNAIVLDALASTAAWLTERFGGVEPERYRWSDYHGTSMPAVWGSALALEWTPSDGGLGTVNVSEASFFEDGRESERLTSSSGPLYRMVSGFAEDGTPEASVTVARGNSGEPSSPFFGNTTSDWFDGNYVRLLFRTDDYLADSQETLTLTPE